MLRFALIVLSVVTALCPLLAAGNGPVTASHGMVVSGDSLASEAGCAILRSGGNAVDAAVAVGFALAVTFPEAGNIGGGGYLLLRLRNGKSVMIDFRETAPGAATRDMYLDSVGHPITHLSVDGHLSAAVPGTVAGLLAALDEYGSMSRETVLAPAIALAEHGVRVNRHLAEALREELPGFRHFPSTMKVFTRNGEPYAEGDTLRQPDLGRTLRAIAEDGEEGFYEGTVAELIAAEMRRGGGIITEEDLEDYRAIERQPLHGSYRDVEILTASPSSGGGVILLQILNMLERFPLRDFGPSSPEYINLFASTAQRAYADRATYLGDPEFATVPVDALISKDYGVSRASAISADRRTPSAEIRSGEAEGNERHQTTHFCVVDRDGNVASVTYTLNELFGSKVVVDGAGFFLNDEMDDFSVAPGVSNIFGLTGGEANAIHPGKRMLSSMTPTILLRDGLPVLLLGARGGSRIPTSVAQVVVNVVDFGMGIEEAVRAPRVHHQWMPDVLRYEPGFSASTTDRLKKMGYVLSEAKEGLAKVEAIQIDPRTGQLIGGADYREGGAAVGY
jgi:gamma-glutamyltranspeptidase / glutathione hydrolase